MLNRLPAAIARVLTIGVAVTVSACQTPSPSAAPLTTAGSRDRGGLSADQHRRAEQLVSIFENGTPSIRYDYAADLHDGRGITAGRAGFTTSDGDALLVVAAYTQLVPANPLASFAPPLQRLKDGDDTVELPEAAYIAAWKQAAADPVFRQVQDDQVDQRYFHPAMARADMLGLTTALARAELLDAAIQHGLGPDRDSLPTLIERTTSRVGPPTAAGEQAWLEAFFSVRIDDLRAPANSVTRDEWAESVDRVESVRRIAADTGYDHSGPLDVVAFGSTYHLD